MKFTIDRNRFLRALWSVHPCVAVKSSMPILESVYIKSAKGSITLSSNNLYGSASTTLDGTKLTVIKTGADVVIPLKRLIKAVANFDPDLPLEIETDDSKLPVIHIRSGTSHAAITAGIGFDPCDFPRWKNEPAAITATCYRLALSDALSSALYAMSADTTRPYLCGVGVEFSDGLFRVTSTDGHRLVIASTLDAKSGAGDGAKVFVSSENATALSKWLNVLDVYGNAKIDVEIRPETTIHFQMGSDDRLSLKLSDEKFPPFRRVVPVDGSTLLVKRDVMLSSLKKCLGVHKHVEIVIGPDSMTLKSQDPDCGEWTERVVCKPNGTPFCPTLRIGFETKYLVETLKTATEEEVLIRYSDALTPFVIEEIDRVDTFREFIHVVMPIRL